MPNNFLTFSVNLHKKCAFYYGLSVQYARTNYINGARLDMKEEDFERYIRIASVLTWNCQRFKLLPACPEVSRTELVAAVWRDLYSQTRFTEVTHLNCVHNRRTNHASNLKYSLL